MKKWNLLNSKTNIKKEDLIDILLVNRFIKTEKQKKEFISPNISNITLKSLKIDLKQVEIAVKRTRLAIKNKEKIIVFGDYDVDGICGAAVIWETLNEMGANALPYIPSRFEEGYGLSKKGIDNVIEKNPDIKLIITVDNGIVANDAVDYANTKGIDVIITDHHVSTSKLPKAQAIVHTTLVCGAAVGYFFSKELGAKKDDDLLELVVLATIADLVPLIGPNRAIVKFGLSKLRKTKRPGLLSLFRICGLDNEKIGVYEIGHMIAPRLNAMGRLKSAMDSLRLVCTNNLKRANDLASVLSTTNLERQEITGEVLSHAKNKAKDKLLNNLIFIADESYQQGVIGLVAGRLVEEFYLPSIVISKGKEFSKASARSINGVNIIEFLREASDLLVDVGGHPMAAGFTVETKKLDELEKKLYEIAAKLISKDHLERVLSIDLELTEDLISLETLSIIQDLAPFGMANPEPLFKTSNLRVLDTKLLGKEGKHLKIRLRSINAIDFEAIAFGMGTDNLIKIGDIISIAYTIDLNEWNGNTKLQLKIKDLNKN